MLSVLSGIAASQPTVASRDFGHLSTGESVHEYTLSNDNGMVVKVLDFGGIITQLHVPDRDGRTGDVVLGFDELASYEEMHPYFGAVVGRYAGRIANGQFSIDGNDYSLATNNDPNHLHGGIEGFDKAVWKAEITGVPGQLKLRHVSPDGDEGYPGTLKVAVVYTLTNDNELHVEYRATTDAPTVLNLTQHSYFNLSGNLEGNILDHSLQVIADSYLELDHESIPTGAEIPVAGTAFDFLKPKRIGERIDDAGGYDHNWILSKGTTSTPAIVLEEAGSGRRLEVMTNQPGVQVYTANYLDGTFVGKGGEAYGKHSAICLETQHFPDSPNHARFPSTRLAPGDEFRSTTVFRFSATPQE